MIAVGVLLERERELAALTRALAELRRGHGCALIIEGEPGTGKSVLLQELARHAATQACLVLADTASPLDKSIPFGTVRRLLRERQRTPELSGALERLDTAALSMAAAVEAGAVIVDDLADAISSLATDEQSVVVVVDDVQWVDPGTLQVLRALAERAASVPALLAIAVRSDAGDNAAYAGLRSVAGTIRLVLAELSEAGASELVLQRLPDADHAFAAACHEATRGNPFLLEELTLDFVRRDLVPDSAAAARVRSLVPRTVLDGVLVRLAELGTDAIALALAVAVLGDDAPLHQAAALARVEPDAAAVAARLLVEAVILAGHDRLLFRHPLLASAIVADAGDFRVAGLHRRAADLLHEEGAIERCAAHLLRATPEADPSAVERLRHAAKAALRRGDAENAARFLERALLEPPRASDLPRVLVDAAKADTAAGGSSGADWLERALALLDTPDERAEVLIELARIRYLRTEFAVAAELATRAFNEIDKRSSLAGQARAVWLFAAQMGGQERAVGEEVQRWFADYGAGRPPTEPEQQSLFSLLLIEAQAPADQVAALAGDAIEQHVARAIDGPTYVVDNAGGALVYVGALDETERLTCVAYDAAVRSGSIIAAAAAAAWRGVARLRRGDIDGAANDAEIALAPERHGWRLHTGQAAALRAMVCLEQADLAGARAAIALAQDMTNPQPLHLIAAGWVGLAVGDIDGAERAFREAGRQLVEIWKAISPVAPWRAGLAHALVARGDRGAALDIASEELNLARALRVPYVIAVSLQACAAASPVDEAVEQLREAVMVLTDTPEALERVRARVNLGAALRRVGERQAARLELATAYDEAQRLSLTALAARARDEQEASGARPRRQWARGPESLTPTEHRIAKRAAGGESNVQIANALFLTRKTVEWHLGNVFRKLGVAHRAELAAALDLPVPR